MKLDAIGITAKNIKDSVRFYTLLGLDFPDLTEGTDHIEARTASGLRLMLDTEELMKKINPQWEKPAGQRMALAFNCDSPAKVDETFKKVIASGYKPGKDPWDAFWGQRYASVIDPDGNAVDLFAPLS